MGEIIMLASEVPADLLEFFEPVDFNNRQDIFKIATEPTPFSHYATFPQALITPMIQAGCPAQVCSVCGAPWERVTERTIEYDHITTDPGKSQHGPYRSQIGNGKNTHDIRHGVYSRSKTLGFRPTCAHTDAPTRPGIVLDMFGGSGTVGLVAMRLGRHYILCDLSPEYVALARRRLATADPYQPTPISETGETQLSLFEVTP
jgi:site-specific DNA-methyltransferase (adenine-specific)